MPALSILLCPTCGETIPPGTVQGLCPRCVWRVSFEETDEDENAFEPWLVLGDNELFEEIARGGMGVVYRARQRRLDREVAVKVLRGGEFADAEARKRFQIEAEAVARLQHPGIVAIHDVGEDDGVPWFSMDYLPGGSLVRQVGETPLPANTAAVCLRQVASAVQHAHEHGVLHRDLKPSNILLGGDGLPRVTDFGIARPIATDAAMRQSLTRTGQGLGSPGYAAPELALGGKADVRTDVYGLGAVLYYLLTGHAPFQGPTLDSILLQLRENDPVPPRRLNPTVPLDLETICLHALAREPDRRYATAEELGEELGRFLAGEPIRARPLTVLGHALRWGRRYPWLAAMAGLVIFLLAALIASGFLYGARQTSLERRSSLLSEARKQRLIGMNTSRRLALAALLEAWSIKPSAEIRNEVIACLSLPEITFGGTQPLRSPPPRSRAGEMFSATFSDNEVLVSEVSSGTVIHTLVHPRKVFRTDWRGDSLVTMCEDRFIYIWDAATGKLTHRLSGHEGLPAAVVFRNGGQEFASLAQDGHVCLWHAARGEEVVQFDGGEPQAGPAWWEENDSRLYSVRLDGKGLDFFNVTWPRISKILAPPSEELHTENTGSLAVSPDGKLAATVDERVVRVWDVVGTRLVATVKKSATEWMSVRFAPDGKALWVCGFDTGLLRLPIRCEKDAPPVVGISEKISVQMGMRLADVRPDGKQLVLAHNNDGRWLLFTPSEPALNLAAKHLSAAAYSPDGRHVVTTSYSESGACLWSLPGGGLEREIPTDSSVEYAYFTLDGRWLWLLTQRHIQRFDTKTWQCVFSITSTDLRGLIFSPDGTIAACQERNVIRLLKPNDLSEIARLTVPPFAGSLGNASLAFDQSGATLGVHTTTGTLIVWNLQQLRSELKEMGMAW